MKKVYSCSSKLKNSKNLRKNIFDDFGVLEQRKKLKDLMGFLGFGIRRFFTKIGERKLCTKDYHVFREILQNSRIWKNCFEK